MAEPQLRMKSDTRPHPSRELQQSKIPDSLEAEIECPRCHDDMTLCSEFDSLYYFCDVCDFCLFTLKKN